MNGFYLADGLVAVNGVLIGVNGWNLWRTHGHRKAAADAHRRADQAALDAALYAQLATIGAGSVAPSGNAEPGEGASVSETPDLVDPIVGWRCWEVGYDGHLIALNAGGGHTSSVWEPRNAKRAVCNRHSNGLYFGEAPKPTHTHGPYDGCSCGFYAAKLLAKAQWPSANYAYGRVAMWGKVIEHEGGYRAEYAYPVEVILVAKSGRKSNGSGGIFEIASWSDEMAENIRLRMGTMYGIPVSIGSDDAMRDEWAAQYLDLPLPPQVVPLLSGS